MSSNHHEGNEVAVTYTGPISGLRFRRFRGEPDYEVITAVIAEGRRGDRIEMVDTVEDVKVTYSSLTNCDPYEDMVFAEVDGKCIAFTRVDWSQEIPGPRVYTVWGYVVPEWQRKGLGRALLKNGERRLREIASTHIVETSRVYRGYAADTAAGREALLRSEGYKPERYFFDMVRENLEYLPDAPLPPGLEVREVQPEHYRTIFEADAEAFRDHWGFREPTEEDFQRWRNSKHFDPSLWRIAWDGDQVAGQVKSYIKEEENRKYSRKRGYTEDISVGRPWRKRGLAKALIVQSIELLKKRGMTEAALGVDSQNPTGALRLYEHCGYKTVKRWTCLQKPMEL
jgi:GNAT superfamily N-acetyltransferase